MAIFADAIVQAFRLLFSGASDLWGIIGLSLQVSGTATVVGMVFGLPAGFLLGTKRFHGKSWALTLVNTGMAFPPVVIGLIVFMLLTREGLFGGLGLIYTATAMIIAQVVLTIPIIAGVTAAAVAQVPKELALQARSLGASRLREAWLVLMEARVGVLAAIAAGFGGAISEVGASMMVGGNLEGQTRVMTTFIMTQTSAGQFGLALGLGIILIIVTLAVNAVLTWVQQSGSRYDS
jgi:tungstate transport system permease protein